MSEIQVYDTVNADARERTLHLLPVLQADPFDKLTAEDITLSVTTSWMKEPVSPEGGWVIRQPYPNELYYVGGSPECQLGELITLPPDLTAGEVVFHWSVAVENLPPGRFQIEHRIELTFEAGEGRTYSMDVANWWAQSQFAGEGHSTPEIGRNRFSRLKHQGISPTRRAHVHESIREGCRFLDIQESLTLPAITLNDCWTIHTYGGESAHSCLEALR